MSFDDDDDDEIIDMRLDSESDTIEEVTNLLKMYPKKRPPSILKTIRPQTVVFIPTILSLLMKLVDEENIHRNGFKRYGLIRRTYCRNNSYNTIKKLVDTPEDIESKDRYDEDCATVMLWLIKERLILPGDVKEYRLLERLISNNNYFAERRFQILVNLSPDCLVQVDSIGRLPLYTVTDSCRTNSTADYHRVFSVLKAGIQKFPKHKGVLLLFSKTQHFPCGKILPSDRDYKLPSGSGYSDYDSDVDGADSIDWVSDDTVSFFEAPFKSFFSFEIKKYQKMTRIKSSNSNNATPSWSSWCDRMNEEALRRSNVISTVLNDPTLCCPPYDREQALLVAATSEHITFDGVCFILRRELDVLKNFLPPCYGGNNNDSRTNTTTSMKRNTKAERNSAPATSLL